MFTSTVQHLSIFGHKPSFETTLEAARRAQQSWSQVPVKQRLQPVRSFRRLLADRAVSLARAVELPERSLSVETLSGEILPLADACRFLESSAGEILRPSSAGGWRSLLPGGLALKRERSPWGLVLVICAGNYPIFLPGVQAVQALVAGNAVLLKPAPGTAGIVTTVAEMLVEAGVDPGLMVVLDETPESAQRVIAHGVDKVLFTGSSATGRAVLSQLVETLTPATLELSGCDSVFVHPQADLKLVVEALRFGLSFNGSATCIAPRRVFVTANRVEELEELLAAIVDKTSAVDLTPDRSSQLRELVQDALRQGARLVGSEMKFGSSTKPVILADVRPDMKVACTDVFAPLLSILSVASFAEALELDGQCSYSLGASVFGPSAAATEWAAEIRAGVVVINDLIAPTADPRVPFGGRGESGFGVTRGAEGLLELTQPKAVIRRGGRWRPHFQTLQTSDEELFAGLIRAKHGGSWRQRARGCLELGGAIKSRSSSTSEK